MIFSGRILTDGDNDSLHSQGIQDGCVLHCIISDQVSGENSSFPEQVEDDIDICEFLMFIYCFIIIVLSSLIFVYRIYLLLFQA